MYQQLSNLSNRGEQKKEKDNIALMEWYGSIRGEIEVVHLVMFSC